MRRGVRRYDDKNLGRVKALRREASVSELVLWELLRDQELGFKFKRQYPAGIYVLDFYSSEANLAVEVDGELHKQRQDKDAVRDAWFLARGVETIRVPSLDLFEYTGQVGFGWLRAIQEACERRSGRSAFPE